MFTSGTRWARLISSGGPRFRLMCGRSLGWLVAIPTVAVALVLAPTASAGVSRGHDHGPGRLALTTVSNPRPQLVSGDEVLVRRRPVASAISAGAMCGSPPTAMTSPPASMAQSDGSLLGFVTGLTIGRNRLVASPVGSARRRSTSSTTPSTVRSSPASSSFRSSARRPHSASQPRARRTALHRPWSRIVYKNTSGAFVPLADPDEHPGRRWRPPPSTGAACPTSCASRPASSTAPSIRSPRLRRAGARHRSSLTPAGTASSSTPSVAAAIPAIHQGTATGGVLDDQFLSLGYAVASSTLNVLDNNCSTIISAEAAMMVKEHFIDTYGPLRSPSAGAALAAPSSSTRSPTPTPAS